MDRLYRRLHRLLMPPGLQQNAFHRFGVRMWTRFDVATYRLLGWSAAAAMMRTRVLLLRTTGRRSGRRRGAMVAYVEHDGHLLIGGGNWGWDRDPGWLYNVIANPNVDVRRGRTWAPMTATVLSGDEAAAAGNALSTAFPHSQTYVERRVRPIPYIRLDPSP